MTACQQFEALGIPLRMRAIPNGPTVIEEAQQTSEALALEVLSIVKQYGSLSAIGLAQIRSMPVVLAQEQLLFTEKLGHVCRDDSMEGMRFYPNRFVHP